MSEAASAKATAIELNTFMFVNEEDIAYRAKQQDYARVLTGSCNCAVNEHCDVLNVTNVAEIQ